MSRNSNYGEVKVPCQFGTLVARYSGDPGYFEGIEIDLILPDGGEMQCALVECSASNYGEDLMQIAVWNGDEESPIFSSGYNPNGEWSYR